MASKLYPAAGAKVYIGGIKQASGDLTAADFASETFTEIAGVTDMGSHGDAGEIITSKHINATRVRKIKSPIRDGGQKELVVDFDSADPGQQAVVAASLTEYPYAFKVVFNDAPSPGGTGSIRYFTGFVMSVVEGVGSASDALKRTIAIEVDSNLVSVAAAA